MAHIPTTVPGEVSLLENQITQHRKNSLLEKQAHTAKCQSNQISNSNSINQYMF